MALIVEDGTAKADAESYISVADATIYHAARGNAAWAALASDTIREQLLRKATDYMLQYYRSMWKGLRATTTQLLDWPRANVELSDMGTYYGYGAILANNVVPLDIRTACADLALIAASGDLAPDIGQLVKREKIGPLETEYADNAPAYTIYRSVAMKLAPYVGTIANTVSLIRC